MIDSEAESMHGRKWEYVAHYIGTPHENGNLLARMEEGGWDVLNITGTDSGNDVIWFKRPLKSPKPLAAKTNPCAHGIENYGAACITCGGPV